MAIISEDSSEGRLALRLDELALPALDSYLSPRSFSWLGEHGDEAAELAALLHEAAPKLALASLRTPPTGSGRTQGLPKARSYEVSDTIRDRLRAAVPMPTGPGQIEWSNLVAIISSEMLKFDEANDAWAQQAQLLGTPPRPGSAAAAATAAAAGSPVAPAAAGAAAAAAAEYCEGMQAPSPTPVAAASPRSPSGGQMLEINSGGRVIFCLFARDAPRAPTPPCSLQSSLQSSVRSSPEKEAAAFIARARQLAKPRSLDVGAAPAEAGAAAEHSGCSELSADESLPTLHAWHSGQTAGTSGSGWGAEAGDALLGEQGAEAATQGCELEEGADERLRQLRAADPVQQQQQQQQWSPGSPTSSGCTSSSYGSSPASTGSLSSGAGEPQPSGGSFSFPRAAPAGLARQGSAAGDQAGGPATLVRMPGTAAPEGCLILKFVSSRLLCQSEQFASELTRHVGLCTPDSRILRQKGATEHEWREAYEAAAALKDRFPDLHEEMARNSCCLVMEFIPGGTLFKHMAAFSEERVQQTAEDLGRLFTLDMLLGNADRLHCRELAWRGNPENILYATGGRWAGRAVAIDAVVQRRPPGGLMSVEDRSCERLAELALNDAEVAGALLRQALQPRSELCAALDAPTMKGSAAAFQRGLKAALDAAVTIKGLLEMMFEVTAGWIDSFLEDIEEGEGYDSSGGNGGGAGPPATTPRSASASRRVSSAGGMPSPLLLTAAASTTAQTMRIRQINHEAQRNDSVGEKVAEWKVVFREKGEELRAAVEEWQVKRAAAESIGAQPLTTAFLDGTHPVVDVYELKVRLEHMLQRLRVLQQATLTGRPCRLMPRLYLSGAVEASSLHLLRHLGITHVLNATEDLLLPEADQGFVTMRCPLRDMEEEDLSPHLPDASAFIDEGLASGGSILVHCHAGKSRSCSLVLAWLMTRRRWPLNRAMEFLHRVRPEAAPNAGYLAALLRLEEGLFGRQTVKMKKTKPEPRSCPVCGDKVGLSADSVRVHLRLKHPGAVAVLARSGNSSQDGSGNWADALSSPSGSSPRSSMGVQSSPSAGSMSAGGSGHLLSPRSAARAGEVAQQAWQQQRQQHGQLGGDSGSRAPGHLPSRMQQQQEQAGVWGMPHAEVPAVLTSPRPQSTGAGPQWGAAQAAGREEVPDSPPMAAVLNAAETAGVLVEGLLSESDAEEFLSAAASGMA